MRTNHRAFSYANKNGLFKTGNAIDSLSRQFGQFEPKSLKDKIKEFLEPFAKAKAKFDDFMTQAEEYQLELQNADPDNRAKPYTEAYNNWKDKKDEKDRDLGEGISINEAGELDIEPVGLDELEALTFAVDDTVDIVGSEDGTELDDVTINRFKGVGGLAKYITREVKETVVEAGEYVSNLYESSIQRAEQKSPNVEILQEETEKIEDFITGVDSDAGPEKKRIDVRAGLSILQNTTLSIASQIKSTITTNAIDITRNAQTELELLSGTQGTSTVTELKAQQVLERLGFSQSGELLEDLKVDVNRTTIRPKGSVFISVFEGTGTANVLDFDNEPIPISYTLTDFEGEMEYSTQSRAESAIDDEDYLPIGRIIDELVIKAEPLYNS